MALLSDHLSLWEIGYRWAGQDSTRVWLRIPLPVRDNFRLLMEAILDGHLQCETLGLAKWNPDKGSPEMYIRHYTDEVYQCINGVRFDSKLLKWASIERWAMQEWCERQGVPLPEFWFPPGWKIDYEWPAEKDEADASPKEQQPSAETPEVKTLRIATYHRIKLACQQIALKIWSQEPTLTIKEMANRKEIQELGGGSECELETVQGWISEVDPRNPAKKRGRKRKNNPVSDQPGH